MKKRLGLDVGERTVGVAIGHGWLVSPVSVWRWEAKRSNDVKRVIDLIEEKVIEEEIEEIIVGQTSGLNERVIDIMIEGLRERLQTVVIPIDEAYSSREAREKALEVGKKLRNFKADEDSWAAAVILERYLEGQH